MPPYAEEVYVGSIGFNRPLHNKGGDNWLDGKRKYDGVEGLWRIHDDLYDLTDFISRHPGGPQWLELTKGTDITEAFETHHIFDNARNILPKFHVKKAETPRASPFTFNESDFYRTLKRRIVPKLQDLPKSTVRISALYTDALMVSMFIFSVLACRYQSFLASLIAGVFMGSVTVAAHNYLHQRDNIRMYYFNFSLLSYREFRISHALSHHLYTNTIVDMEMFILQPYLEFFPINKGWVVRYLSWIYSPIMWMFFFHLSLLERITNLVAIGDARTFAKSDWVACILPLAMYILGGLTMLETITFWSFVVMAGSFHFAAVGLNAAHHHPDIFHDGDTPREDKDWGISQLDAVMDRKEITGSHYLVLTNFGDHALHHLFPTLDQGLLDKLYPTFKEVMKEFNLDLRITSQLEMIKGHFKQLARSEPNPNPPNLFANKIN